VRRPVIRPALAELRPDQLRDLRLHQLVDDPAYRLAHDISGILKQNLRDDLLDRHPFLTGHQWCLLSRRTVKKSDDDERRGGRNHLYGPESRRPKPLAAIAQALRTAYTASISAETRRFRPTASYTNMRDATPDRPGIIAAVSLFLFKSGSCHPTSTARIPTGPSSHCGWSSRSRLSAPSDSQSASDCVPSAIEMNWRLCDSAERKRLAILVSKLQSRSAGRRRPSGGIGSGRSGV